MQKKWGLLRGDVDDHLGEEGKDRSDGDWERSGSEEDYEGAGAVEGGEEPEVQEVLGGVGVQV